MSGLKKKDVRKREIKIKIEWRVLKWQQIWINKETLIKELGLAFFYAQKTFSH